MNDVQTHRGRLIKCAGLILMTVAGLNTDYCCPLLHIGPIIVSLPPTERIEIKIIRIENTLLKRTKR